MLGLREVCVWFAGAIDLCFKFACGLREPYSLMLGLPKVCVRFV